MREQLPDLEKVLDNAEMGDTIWDNVKQLYFEPKSAERWNDGRIYEWIGLKVFKNVCTYFGRKMGKDGGQKNNYFIWYKSENGIKEFEKKTRFNEGMHLIGTVVPVVCFTPGWIDGDPFVVYVGGVLTAINAYSLLLQRYNRSRIYSTLDKMESRK
jgi:hypothetical protein